MIYAGQTLLTLKLNAGIDVATSTVKRIIYKKPSGTQGYWPADTIEGNSILTYNIQTGNLDEVGTWSFQVYVEVGGKKGYGHPITVQVNAPLQTQ
jgi:hypothetical protein